MNMRITNGTAPNLDRVNINNDGDTRPSLGDSLTNNIRDDFNRIRNAGPRHLPVAAQQDLSVGFHTDPQTGVRTLQVRGTTENDNISITREDPKDPKSRYVIEVNGVKTFAAPDKFDQITIEGGAGDDRIHVGPGATPPRNEKNDDIDRLRIAGGDGDDRITNEADGATIMGGRGDDEIVNRGDDAVIGTPGRNAGEDTIINHGRRVNMFYQSGNQYVTQNGDAGNLYLGGGNDRVWIKGNNNVVETGGGNNQVTFEPNSSGNTVRADPDAPAPRVTDRAKPGTNKVEKKDKD